MKFLMMLLATAMLKIHNQRYLATGNGYAASNSIRYRPLEGGQIDQLHL